MKGNGNLVSHVHEMLLDIFNSNGCFCVKNLYSCRVIASILNNYREIAFVSSHWIAKKIKRCDKIYNFIVEYKIIISIFYDFATSHYYFQFYAKYVDYEFQ